MNASTSDPVLDFAAARRASRRRRFRQSVDRDVDVMFAEAGWPGQYGASDSGIRWTRPKPQAK